MILGERLFRVLFCFFLQEKDLAEGLGGPPGEVTLPEPPLPENRAARAAARGRDGGGKGAPVVREGLMGASTITLHRKGLGNG